jgi:hypothetical protein
MGIGILSEDTNVTDLGEGQVDPKILAHHCVDWSVGPLRVHACIDLSVPEADVTVYLLGVRIGQARLDRSHLCTTLGGSVHSFKAKVKLCLALNPLRIIIDAELCLPILGCKKFHKEIHLSAAQELESGVGAVWEQ